MSHTNRTSPDEDQTVTGVEPMLLSTGNPVSPARFVRQSLLGKGGGGAVYRAFDLKLKREVAIKVPWQCAAGDRQAERTFRCEVEATSRLRHPYVVTLFDFEFNDSEAILVYEFIDGEDLASWIGKHPHGIEATEAAEVVKKIAHALHHAHTQQILHRDIKPSNILLDQKHAEISASLEPRLADFGLAQLLHDHTRTESNRELVGSIHYIPPEVIRQSADAYSFESDVYSLGTVLYELLTGEKPFQGSTVAEVLQKIGKGDFALPRTINREIPRDLEAICLRAMAMEPSNRFVTAELFAQDLDRFLTHRPVLARHPGVAGIVNRWIQRNPTLSSALTLSTFALAGFVFLMVSSHQRLSAVNETISETNRRLSKALKSSQIALFHNEQMTYCAAMRTAAEFVDAGRLRDARTVLKQYGDGTELVQHRDFEWQHLQSQIQRESNVIWQTKNPLYCFASLDSSLLVGGAESQLTVLATGTNQVVQQWNTDQGEVNAIAIDESNGMVFTSGDDGSIVAFDLHSFQEKWRVKAFTDQRANDLIYSKDNNRLYCLGHLHEIVAVDIETQTMSSHWTSPMMFSTTMRLLNESTLLVGSDRGNVCEVSLESGEILDSCLLDTETQITSMVVVDPQRVAIVTNNSLFFYDPSRNQILQTVALAETPSSLGHCVADRSYVVAMKEGGIHRFIEDKQGQVQIADRWANDGDRIYQIGTLPDGSAVITADQSGALLKWNDLPENHVFVKREDADLSLSIDILPRVSSLDWPDVAVGCDRGAYVHDFNQRSKRCLEKETEAVTSIKHWPGELSLLGSYSGTGTILNHDSADDGQIISAHRESLGIHSHPLVTGSSDGQWIGGGSSPTDLIWLKDRKSGSPICEISASNPHVLTIRPHEDRAYWNNDTAIHYCKLSQPKTSVELVKFNHVPEHLAFSADGATIAISLSNHEIRLWDMKSNELRSQVFSSPEVINAIGFTATGRSLIAMSTKATLRCWNVQTGQLTLEKSLMQAAPTALLNAVSFTPDLRFVAIRPADRSVHMFRLY